MELQEWEELKHFIGNGHKVENGRHDTQRNDNRHIDIQHNINDNRNDTQYWVSLSIMSFIPSTIYAECCTKAHHAECRGAFYTEQLVLM
jgi:hypothetical protein